MSHGKKIFYITKNWKLKFKKNKWNKSCKKIVEIMILIEWSEKFTVNLYFFSFIINFIEEKF